jgi:hypothetical protein
LTHPSGESAKSAVHRASAGSRPSSGRQTAVSRINAYARKNVAGYDSSADHKTRTEIEQLPLLPSFGIKYSF